MPFKKRDIPSFNAWEPGKDFKSNVDRLLISTTFNDTFVAKWSTDRASSGHLIMDPDFLPQNIQNIPRRIRNEHRIDVLASGHPWQVNLHDGVLAAGGGHFIEMTVIGNGWILEVTSSVSPTDIKPANRARINRRELCHDLDGIRFGEFRTTSGLPVEAMLLR